MAAIATEKAKGIDVSHWQGDIDFKKVASAGYTFVLHNAGFGKYLFQKDEYFERNYAAAKKAGLKVGAYWYSYALTEADALAEAETFLAAVKGKTFEYPLAFDIEDPSQSELNRDGIDKLITTFCTRLEKAGYYAAVYSYADLLNRRVSDSVKSRFDVWVAHFDVAKPSAESYGIWQYTSKGSVSGVNGHCDCNYAYRDYPALIRSKGLNGFTKSDSTPQLDKIGCKKGDKSSEVLALKYLLMIAKERGLHNVKLDKNNIFGSGTQKAVNAILKGWGYGQNGIAGDNFIHRLGKELLKGK